MTRYSIDIRSDIHTEPTPEMRRAMAEAELGGDAIGGEDPVVRNLEETAAAMFAKEAGLLVCSGTMGNLASLLAISRPGDGIVADPWTHMLSSEADGFRRVAGCHLMPVETDGVLTGEAVRQCLQDQATIRGACVICVENTHSFRGGVPWATDILADLVRAAKQHDLRLHIDGARIFNAAAATGASVADLTAGADTVQVCLAKGLGAPAGSLVLGARDVIERVRECRQMLGGGIHKAGVIAAAGLVALRDMPSRLCEDHRRARQLSRLLAEMPLLRLAHPVQTNIIDLAFDSSHLDGQRLVACAAASGVGVAGPWNGPWGGWIRLATHYGIADEDLEQARDILRIACREARRCQGRQ